MNYSKQRELIMEAVKHPSSHVTAEEVYQRLRPTHPTLSLGTVYRNLNQLSQHGLLRKIPVSNGCDRFDCRLEEHYHLLCDTCGRLYDVEFPALSRVLGKTIAKSGFTLTGCDFLIRGICRECGSENNIKE